MNDNTKEIKTTDDEIRKYRKQVDRNGWKVRLHVWTTGEQPRNIGYCPFFWKTWAFVALSPLTAAGKVVMTGFDMARELMKSEQVEKPRVAKIVRPCDSDLVELARRVVDRELDSTELYNSSYLGLASLEGYFADIRKWLVQNPDWLSLVPAAQERINARQAKLAEQKARSAKLRALSQPLLDNSRYIVWPIMVASLVYLTYKFYYLIGMLWSFIHFKALAIGAMNFALAALLLFVASIVISLAIRGVKILIAAIPSSAPEVIAVKSEPSWASRAIKGIVNAIGFVIETAVMMYKKECPLIEWADEEGKIERRK